jgi:succinate dehydrogenase / fumarate reductase membrane anchor subunit
VSLVTPLNRVLGLGTAGGAGEHWWLQRVTSVALLLLGLWLAYALLTMPDFTYSTVHGWVQRPVNGVLLILLIGTVAYHSYLGLQVVIEDYVTTKSLKVAAVMGSGFAHWGLTIATVFAVLRIAFGPSA